MNKLRRHKQKRRRKIRRDWDNECLRYCGRILPRSKYSHYCMDWDGLPVDEFCIEFTTCYCFDTTPEFISAVVACKKLFDRLGMNEEPISMLPLL